MKKAKFLSKLSKFENFEKKAEEKPSKAEVAKKTKIFESGNSLTIYLGADLLKNYCISVKDINIFNKFTSIE